MKCNDALCKLLVRKYKLLDIKDFKISVTLAHEEKKLMNFLVLKNIRPISKLHI
jgi:hypothetical protein